MPRAYRSFADFWPFYVAEHSKPATRAFHFAGTAVALVVVVILVATRNWWWLPIVLVPGYAAAWAGHFFIEKNRPATFTYPLWSFLGDQKMFGLMLAGRMNNEIQKLSETGPPRSAAPTN